MVRDMCHLTLGLRSGPTDSEVQGPKIVKKDLWRIRPGQESELEMALSRKSGADGLLSQDVASNSTPWQRGWNDGIGKWNTVLISSTQKFPCIWGESLGTA